MGKKHDKKKKKSTKVVLSLAEFNEDAGIGGVDPELSALPSAPKAAEEWEAAGGRPEYNSRGYKERKTYADRNFDADAEFDDRDWVRKGPLDAPDSNGFGAGGPDRDWGDMRRGPLDGPEAAAGPDAPERNWDAMRRGPVESAFSAAAAPERDWGTRKGPVEADLGAPPVERDWGARAGNAVEAEFSSAPAADRDWAVRKGPVEADHASAADPAREADWTAPRKGPVESEFVTPEPDRDWTQRKGPVEAAAAAKPPVEDADWSARKGPVEAEVPDKKPDVADRDWSARRGPVTTEVDAAQKAVRDIDFGEMRRGSRLQEMEKERPPATKELQEKPRPEREDRWRRDSGGFAGRQGPAVPRERPASTGHDGTPKIERDWGAARRTQPMRAASRPNRARSARVSDISEASDTSPAPVDGVEANKTVVDDDWTTVRNVPTKRASGSAGSRRRDGRGGLQWRGGREMPDKATSSPVTPIASAVSES